jgi:hypothetical protein
LRAVPRASLDGPAFRDLKVKAVTELATLLQEKAPADPNWETPSDSTFRVKLWGTRGSIPVSGPEYRRYGGNTPCIEISCGKRTLIFDAGSGIRPAGLSLLQAGVRDV